MQRFHVLADVVSADDRRAAIVRRDRGAKARRGGACRGLGVAEDSPE